MPLWEAIQTDVGRRIQDAESALAEQLGRAVPDGCTLASCALDFHSLQDSILLRAREVDAELVVFGAADARTLAGARHLAALQCVFETREVPCLLVREPFEPPPRRVLLPLSAAEVGQGVLADACEWLASLHRVAPAGLSCTELQVLHVASGPREWRELAPELDRELRWAGDQRQWNGWLRIRRRIRWSTDAHTEILRIAAGQAPSLVLLGPRCGVPNSPEYLKQARTLLLRRLACSVVVLPGTLRSGDEGEAPRAPLPEPQTVGREEPDPAAVMEIAGAIE